MLKVSRHLLHWLPFFKLDSNMKLLLLKCCRLELLIRWLFCPLLLAKAGRQQLQMSSNHLLLLRPGRLLASHLLLHVEAARQAHYFIFPRHG